MNNAPQPQPTRPADLDTALLFLGSWFEKLLHAPERDDATLDAVAAHIILDERPKTLLGLVVTALAEKWLRRHLWMVDFDRLPPSDQGVRVVIDAVLRSARLTGCLPTTFRLRFGYYHSGRSPDWLKSKNPACEAARREAEEDWGK
jgi:hypothetical protein